MIMLSIEEMQKLILFCKQHKVKGAKFGDFSFEFSEASLYESESPNNINQKEELDSSKSLIDTEELMDSKEYEDLLFHSSNS